MAESTDKQHKVKYYGSFSGYNIPLNPVEEIDRSEALSRRTYCVGTYNENGKLIIFEKFIDDSLFFRHEYKYHDNGNIKENKGVDADGQSRTNYYDKSGKRIE